MEKKIKMTGLRTGGKVLSILDIVLGSIFIVAAIGLFVGAAILGGKISSLPSSSAQAQQAAAIIASLNYYGIVLIIDGPFILAFAIAGLKLVEKSDSFGAILTIGILNILVGGLILGILMICIACIECYPNRNKK